MKTNENFYQVAMKAAKRAATRNEVPIGAVVVKDGKIISQAHNQTEKHGNFIAHAEMLALTKAAKKLRTKYLNDCELYVTLEPCMMCRFAAKLCRVKKIHFLVPSLKFGKKGPAYFDTSVKRSVSGLSEESTNLLGMFFRSKRS